MILPSGAYCIIRRKHTDHRGWLLLHTHYWDSEADFQGGKPPVLQSDHDWGPGHEKVADLMPHLIRAIDSEYAAGHRGDRRDPHRVEGPDHLGFLTHTHVAAIEVTP